MEYCNTILNIIQIANIDIWIFYNTILNIFKIDFRLVLIFLHNPKYWFLLY